MMQYLSLIMAKALDLALDSIECVVDQRRARSLGEPQGSILARRPNQNIRTSRRDNVHQTRKLKCDRILHKVKDSCRWTPAIPAHSILQLWSEVQMRCNRGFQELSGTRFYHSILKRRQFQFRDDSLIDLDNGFNRVFSLVVQQERHDEQPGIESIPIDSAAFATRTQRSGYNDNARQGSQGPRPKCTHCGLLGHTIDKCYRIHGCPPGSTVKSRSQRNTSEHNANVANATGV